jgi:hypothetical protein
MKFRIEINGEESFYDFSDSAQINVGRSPTCDIVVDRDGISRKHLQISTPNKDDLFVIDLGSTNGSFINEEQMVVGKEYAFNSFFPIRLGFDVYISILDDLDASLVEFKNKEVSFDDPKPAVAFKKEPTATIKLDREELKTRVIDMHSLRSSRKSKSVTKKDPVRQLKISIFIILFLFVAFVTYEKWSELLFPAPEVVENIPKPKVPPPAKPVSDEQVVVEEKVDYQSYVLLDKCLGQVEAKLCELLISTRARQYYEGVTIIGTKAIFTFSLSDVYQSFQSRFKYTDAELPQMAEYIVKSAGMRINPDLMLKNRAHTYSRLSREHMLGVLLVGEFFSYDFLDILSSSEVQTLILIGYTQQNTQIRVLNTATITREEFETYDVEKIRLAVKVAFLSGVLKPFGTLFFNKLKSL